MYGFLLMPGIGLVKHRQYTYFLRIKETLRPAGRNTQIISQWRDTKVLFCSFKFYFCSDGYRPHTAGVKPVFVGWEYYPVKKSA